MVPVDSSLPGLNFTNFALRLAMAIMFPSPVVDPRAVYEASVTLPCGIDGDVQRYLGIFVEVIGERRCAGDMATAEAA